MDYNIPNGWFEYELYPIVAWLPQCSPAVGSVLGSCEAFRRWEQADGRRCLRTHYSCPLLVLLPGPPYCEQSRLPLPWTGRFLHTFLHLHDGLKPWTQWIFSFLNYFSQVTEMRTKLTYREKTVLQLQHVSTINHYFRSQIFCVLSGFVNSLLSQDKVFIWTGIC